MKVYDWAHEQERHDSTAQSHDIIRLEGSARTLCFDTVGGGGEVSGVQKQNSGLAAVRRADKTSSPGGKRKRISVRKQISTHRSSSCWMNNLCCLCFFCFFFNSVSMALPLFLPYFYLATVHYVFTSKCNKQHQPLFHFEFTEHGAVSFSTEQLVHFDCAFVTFKVRDNSWMWKQLTHTSVCTAGSGGL